MSTHARLRPCTADDMPKIMHMLRRNSLPTIGVEKSVDNFVVAVNGEGLLVGMAGLEVYHQSGLLRSLVVDEESRGLGLGRTLVEAILRNAKERGIKTVYLLTGTAQAYFKRFGFEIVDRNDVDESVKSSKEFTACCDTAVLMRRQTP